MQTEFIKLAVIFIVIMVMVLAKLKLRDAMIVAILLTVILFGIPLGDAAKLMIQSVYEKDTLLVVGSFILVTFLQRIMENRKLLERAEMALQRLSGDRRMVCVIAPVIIGFLPSAGAVNICGAIVDKATGKDLDVEEKTFVTSYYRHISESFSPTYNAILLALSITAVSTGQFVLFMAPMVVVLLVLGYVFYLRKLSKDVKQVRMNDRQKRRIQTASVLFLATGALYCACDRTESFCDQGTAVYYCAFDYCISVKSEGSAGFCKDIGRVENHLQYDHSDDVQEHSYLYRGNRKTSGFVCRICNSTVCGIWNHYVSRNDYQWSKFYDCAIDSAGICKHTACRSRTSGVPDGTFLCGNADFADAHLPCDHYGIFPGILGAADEEDNPGYCGVCSDLDRVLCIAEWIWNIKICYIF